MSAGFFLVALVAMLATVCYTYAYKRYDEEDWDIWSISSLGLGVFFHGSNAWDTHYSHGISDRAD